MKRVYQILGVAIFLVIGLLVGVIVRGAVGGASAAAIDPALRTMVVVSGDMAKPELRAGDILVDLETGAVPIGIHRATVLTDTDCAADAEGVSHCLNEMAVGRATFAIRHHHKMMEEPCFSPTEQVNVIDAATYATLTDES
jgi:hypothetical protein